MPPERDHPPGHPAASDTTREQARRYKPPFNPAERDWPQGHPGAADSIESETVWEAGVDPENPHLEPFKGKPRDVEEGPQPE